jgi:transcriptional regulator with XRE-family HTH domain
MNFVMTTQWRDRIRTTLEKSGKSMRAVSIAAGLGENYLHSVLGEGKEPSIDRLLKIADTLNISLAWLLYGIDIGPQEERLLRLYAKLPEQQRRAILDLASIADQNNDQ